MSPMEVGDAPRSTARPRGRVSQILKGVSVGLAVIAIAAISWVAYRNSDAVRGVWHRVVGETKPHRELPTAATSRPRVDLSRDGTVLLGNAACKAMGIAWVEVQPQLDPIQLELLGTTEYITDTLTKVRPMFKSRVDRVHVGLSQAVKKGEPLLDLYSKELAEAKSTYETEKSQWGHDKWLLESRSPLVKSGAVTQAAFEETKNNEMKSFKAYEIARDKLAVYGLTEREVEDISQESGAQKPRMTLRAGVDGFVIQRDAVPGNLYDENDTLLVIAPLDRLWVWGNVFESDLDLVQLGQSWEIRFPFLKSELRGKVEYISNRVDPSTHAVRVRTSIPNAENRLKSDMLVRGMLNIPPVPGRTVIPRTALVVDDGRYYAFVRKGGQPNRFERRVVAIAQEKDDHAVIESGLAAGEEVVAVGGLILAQIHENARLASTGGPDVESEGGID